MKKLNYLILISLSVILLSCSGEIENEIEETSLSPTSFLSKNFDTGGEFLVYSDSIHYILADNKISEYSGRIREGDIQLSGVYNYKNQKISEIVGLRNGQLVNRTNYTYDDLENLIEYKITNIDVSSSEELFVRHSYTYTSDTIFAITERSTDDVNYNIRSNSKIVLDVNNNRTYYEKFDHPSNITDIIINTYDSRSNLIKEEFYEENQSDPSRTLDITYDTSVNTLHQILAETFTKKTLMLTYHTQADALNRFTPRIVSPNNMTIFNSDFFEGIIRHDIENVINDSNFLEFSQFNIFINNNLQTSFNNEFFFNQ